MKKLAIDVMLDGKYKTTIYRDVGGEPHISVGDIRKEVERRLPALKGKDYQLKFDWVK